MSKEDKREAILQATLKLVAEHGFHDAPCSLIAERGGVAAGTIYRYFENKDMLINTLFLELEAKINAAVLDGYSEQAPFRARFLHLIGGLLNFSSPPRWNLNTSSSSTIHPMASPSAVTGYLGRRRTAVSIASFSSRERPSR